MSRTRPHRRDRRTVQPAQTKSAGGALAYCRYNTGFDSEVVIEVVLLDPNFIVPLTGPPETVITPATSTTVALDASNWRIWSEGNQDIEIDSVVIGVNGLIGVNSAALGSSAGTLYYRGADPELAARFGFAVPAFSMNFPAPPP